MKQVQGRLIITLKIYDNYKNLTSWLKVYF